jgi:hypothetical protein
MTGSPARTHQCDISLARAANAVDIQLTTATKAQDVEAALASAWNV